MNFHLDHAHVPAHAWVEKQNRWQALHNVEDHRKNLVIDGGRAAVVTSHNFFDPAWDWHENLIWLTGDGARTVWRIAQDSVRDALEIPQLLTPAQRAMCTALVDAETTRDTTQLEPALQPVPNFHAGDLSRVQRGLEPDPQCRIVQSEEIRARMEHLLESSSRGDDVVLATTYFSDDPLLDALDRAAARGVRVRVLIDSLHALPLPPLAAWLTRNLVNHHAVTRGAALHTRWGDRFQLRIHNSSAGAMMHLKTLARLGPNGCAVLGQANCTPNSFSGAWLETDIETRAPGVIRAIGDHFDQLWSLPESRPAVPTHTLTARAQSALHSSLLRAFSWFGLRP
jgi:phosphatidylserine/phosphatidylglycerophosphate/cardiolipin synthase-like enzyme